MEDRKMKINCMSDSAHYVLEALGQKICSFANSAFYCLSFITQMTCNCFSSLWIHGIIQFVRWFVSSEGQTASLPLLGNKRQTVDTEKDLGSKDTFVRCYSMLWNWLSIMCNTWSPLSVVGYRHLGVVYVDILLMCTHCYCQINNKFSNAPQQMCSCANVSLAMPVDCLIKLDDMEKWSQNISTAPLVELQYRSYTWPPLC